MSQQPETAKHRDLRRRAESALQAGKALKRALPRGAKLEEILHEFDVLRVELEMQNDELRAVHEELSETRDRYRGLYELAPVGYLTLDEGCRIVEANQRAVTLLGLPLQDLCGRSLASFTRSEDANLLQLHYRRVVEGSDNEIVDITLDSPDADDGAPVHVSSSPIVDKLGQLSGYRSVLVDLSEMRSAEESLRVLEARNTAFLDTTHDAIVRCDDGFTIEAANVAATRLFGLTNDELVGQNLRDLLPDLQTSPPVRSGRGETAPLSGLRRDGSTFPVELRFGPWIERGQPKLLAIITDITDAERRDEELRQAHKMEAVGTLASGVAHDFNNVLQAVLGCLIMARDEETPVERARELIDRAAFAARHGGELARGLLAFARKKKVQLKDLRFDRLIRNTAPLLERLVTELVVVDVVTNAKDALIRADPVQLEQILLNLAANARDAMPTGGRLSLVTELVEEPEGLVAIGQSQPFVRLVVEDTGTGMDARTRERIFEPFFTTKETGKGTGLGLSTVFSLTQELGGRVEVHSTLGQGTRFTFLFPCCEESPSHRSSEYPSPRLFRGTALLVEDEPLIRASIRHHLERLGLTVLEAQHGEEALAAFAANGNGVDLLVSDIVLPLVMGTTLALKLRQQAPDLPVLFMTANPELAERDPFDGCGMLQKPFGFDELAEALAALLPSEVGPESSNSGSLLPAAALAAPPLPRVAVDAPPTVLLVEDDGISGPVLGELLEHHGFRVVLVSKPSDALAALEREAITLVITDLQLPEMLGTELAARLWANSPELPIVFMSGQDRASAPAGAARFIQKPIELSRLLALLGRILGPS